MKLKLLAGVAVVLGVLVIWEFAREEPPQIDSLDARMEQLRKAGDVEALAAEAQSSDIQTAQRAVETMGYVGKKAVRQIRHALADRRPEIRQRAATAYARAAGPKEAPLLAEVAGTDESPTVRATAVTALGHIRAHTEMETLLTAMNDDDLIVRRRAAEAVADILGRRYLYNANDPPAKRRESIDVIRSLWTKVKGAVGAYHDEAYKRRKGAAGKSR